MALLLGWTTHAVAYANCFEPPTASPTALQTATAVANAVEDAADEGSEVGKAAQANPIEAKAAPIVWDGKKFNTESNIDLVLINRACRVAVSVRNDSTRPLVIEAYEASCGCSTIHLPTGTIGPGESTSGSILIDRPTRLGRFGISIKVAGKGLEEAGFSMVGEVRAPFEPLDALKISFPAIDPARSVVPLLETQVRFQSLDPRRFHWVCDPQPFGGLATYRGLILNAVDNQLSLRFGLDRKVAEEQFVNAAQPIRFSYVDRAFPGQVFEYTLTYQVEVEGQVQLRPETVLLRHSDTGIYEGRVLLAFSSPRDAEDFTRGKFTCESAKDFRVDVISYRGSIVTLKLAFTFESDSSFEDDSFEEIIAKCVFGEGKEVLIPCEIRNLNR